MKHKEKKSAKKKKKRAEDLISVEHCKMNWHLWNWSPRRKREKE